MCIRDSSARAFSSPGVWRIVTGDQELDGAAVLPGFRLPLGDWLDRAGTRRGA